MLRGESIEVAVQSSLVKPAALRRSKLLHRRVHRRRPGRIRSCWRSGWSGWISIWSISEEKMYFTWWMPTSLPLISLKGMARELFLQNLTPGCQIGSDIYLWDFCSDFLNLIKFYFYQRLQIYFILSQGRRIRFTIVERTELLKSVVIWKLWTNCLFSLPRREVKHLLERGGHLHPLLPRMWRENCSIFGRNGYSRNKEHFEKKNSQKMRTILSSSPQKIYLEKVIISRDFVVSK